MGASSSNLSVCVAAPVVFIKVCGRANFGSSVNFKTLIYELWQRGCTQFRLDLTDCLIMDSTFLGVLAGFGLKLAESPAQTNPPRITLQNPHARIRDLLENLGIAHLFKIVTESNPAPQKLEPVGQETGNPSKEELSRTCLEAHETLMAIDPANIPKFKDVAKFLAEDLKKTLDKG